MHAHVKFLSNSLSSDRLKQLMAADKVSGALVLSDRPNKNGSYNINGTEPPSSGTSKLTIDTSQICLTKAQPTFYGIDNV